MIREPGHEYDVPEDCLNHPRAVVEFCWSVLATGTAASWGALFVSGTYRPLGYHFAFIGPAERTIAEPREVFRVAVLMRARFLFLFHNHLGGGSWFFGPEVEAVRRFVAAGDRLRIRVLDHIVLLERGRWLSLRDLGRL